VSLRSLAARFAACLALLCLGAAASAERVRSWDTEIYLEGEDTFAVVERIRWDFEDAQRHGILRDIPFAYGRGHAADYRVGLDVVEVTDAAGAAQRWKTSRSGRLLQIRIGDPQRYVSGAVDYVIRYQVRRGVLFFADHDELYWNAIGSELAVPIDRASATVFLPAGVAPEALQRACFTGPFGSVEQACDVSAGVAALTFTAQRRLAPREGLSLVLGLPKGVVREPGRFEKVLARVRDYVNAWAVLPLVTLAALIGIWRTQGRDPGRGAALPVRYEPPEGLTPAEVGVVLDERVDLVDVNATLLDLAVRGYLRIEEVDTVVFVFMRNRDWRLVKLREGDGLRPHEALLFEKLFAARESVTVSSLRNRFYAQLPALRVAVYDAVSREGRYFPTSPDRVRRAWAAAGVAGLAGGAVALVANAPPPTAVAVAVSGALVLLFSRVMPRRTARGRAVYEQILGFREFVTRVDKDRLERMGDQSTARFERILPYALVLGAADSWADAFDGVYSEPPRWYTGPTSGPFQPRVFVDRLGDSLTSIGTALASTPRGSGSAGSGGSGFGGGGFSGGGFGGGGASSW
jgi:uncharacterized membrane protein YgcG